MWTRLARALPGVMRNLARSLRGLVGPRSRVVNRSRWRDDQIVVDEDRWGNLRARRRRGLRLTRR
jgi:hypothetical protein